MTSFLAKITAKGQLTLPVAVRRALGVDVGDYLRIETADDGSFVLKPGARAAELAGIVRYQGPPRSVKEIRAASRATFGK